MNLPEVHLDDKHERRGIGFLEAWRVKNVIRICLSFGFIKLVDYGFLFWLPTYLEVVVGGKKSPNDVLSAPA